MEMTITEFGNRTLRLALVGDLDISGAEKLGLPLAAIAGSGNGMVVDMTRLDCIASIGIRHLVLAARAMGRGRGQLLLLDPNPLVTDTLTTACVDNLLPIVRSEDAAHAALNSYTAGQSISRADGGGAELEDYNGNCQQSARE